MKPHRVYQTTPTVVLPLGKQQVYFGHTRNGRAGLFTAGRIVWHIDGAEPEKRARQIAEDLGFEYVERETEINS